MFTWVPFYVELGKAILKYRNQQDKLLAVLRDLEGRGVPTISLTDLGPDERRTPLAEIDPFTFYANFNRGIKEENRFEILKSIKGFFSLATAVPSEFSGIPIVNNQATWFFRWAKNRQKEDIPNLWQLAETAVTRTLDDLDPELFDRCLKVKGLGLAKLTMGLFWMNPAQFPAADSTNCEYLNKAHNVPWPERSFESYRKYVSQIKSTLGTNFPDISDRAWRFKSDAGDGSEVTVNSSTTTEGEAEAHPPGKRWWAIALGEGGEKWNECQERGIVAIGWDLLGDLSAFPDQEAITEAIIKSYKPDTQPTNQSLGCWQFVHDMQIGDTVVAKVGRRRLLGYGTIESDFQYDPSRSEYRNVRRVKWLSAKSVELPDNLLLPTKTLTEVTLDSFKDFVLEAFSTTPILTVQAAKPYTIEDALDGLFMPREQFTGILDALRSKKNVILQGPPGVGKTFVAKRIAWALLESKDESRVPMVQFHQSYAYEDFIQGYRPKTDGKFELRNGVFHEFCDRARTDLDRRYVFIIDEINRGNLSKIFGELMMLIESDKRGSEYAIRLTYSGTPFSVPENVHLLGLMNTADRSLAMVDYALRRRFRFVELRPQFEHEGFAQHLRKHGATDVLITRIMGKMKGLNAKIETDSKNLGRGFVIGHSFFCLAVENAKADDHWYESVIAGEIEPLLREYWFDRVKTADEWIAELRKP